MRQLNKHIIALEQQDFGCFEKNEVKNFLFIVTLVLELHHWPFPCD